MTGFVPCDSIMQRAHSWYLLQASRRSANHCKRCQTLREHSSREIAESHLGTNATLQLANFVSARLAFFFFLNKRWCYYFIVYQFFTSLQSIKSKNVFQSHRSSLKMQTARYSCRQLNCKTIKSAALCYLSLVFVGKCSIISAKYVCKVEEEGFENAWNSVCRTRDACDRALQGWFVLISNIFLYSLSD